MKLPSTLILAAATAWGSSIAIPTGHAETPSSSSTFQFSTSRGRLGAQVISISESLRRHFGAPADAGLLVDRVLPKTPAAKAGLATGDVIVGVDGSPISEVWDIFKALSGSKKGDTVLLKIVRNNKPRTLKVRLDEDAVGGSMMWNGATGSSRGMPFGNNHWPSESFLRDKSFPFGPGQQQDGVDLNEKIRKLEERIEQLETPKRSPKNARRTKKSPKQFKSTAGGTGSRT